MSRQDVLDFQSYLANKYSLPDGVPASIHQEVFGFVDNYVGAIRPTESDKWTQETIYSDLVKMIWRVVTAVQTHDNAMYPQKRRRDPHSRTDRGRVSSIHPRRCCNLDRIREKTHGCLREERGGYIVKHGNPSDW